MASKDSGDEKPNLRPTKRTTAGGKTIFLHHNPNHPSDKSYIRATWTDTNASEKEDPFGIGESGVEYSLNKRQRWEILHGFRQRIANETDSSSDDDDRGIQSDSEQQRKTPARKKQSARQTKYRLYESHNINQQANCVGITSNTGAQRELVPQKTYMQGPPAAVSPRNPDDNVAAPGNNSRRREPAVDVTYHAIVPPPREKHLANVRKQHNPKTKKATSSVQRTKFTQDKDRMNVMQQFAEDEESEVTDDDEMITPSYVRENPIQLQLNDFIPRVPDEARGHVTSIADDLVTVQAFDPKAARFYANDGKSWGKFHRQVSKEEQMYNRDMATYMKTQKDKRPTTQEKSPHQLMVPMFCSVMIEKGDLTVEHLTAAYGKNFIQAQCYPKKYLICITDRLKSAEWSNDFSLFPIYATLNSYVMIVFPDEASSTEPAQKVQAAVNMDLYSTSLEIETRSGSRDTIYKIDDFIERTIAFISSLPLDTFKPIESKINHKAFVRTNADSDLSDSEFVNKQIRQLQILDKKNTSSKAILVDEQLNMETPLDDYALVKPDICTSCCQDMDGTSPMTALKACAHWMCNDCWNQYIESSIKSVKMIRCPEWNCESIVDVGTLLSLANIRCMNIYERNIEKCLVNVSRSFVKCPAKSCSNIIQVIGAGIDPVRCQCGHEFCIQCKREAHFPSMCSAYQVYIAEVHRNGDLISEYNAVTHVKGRDCVSCNNFIEKNGGCNHMTCRCGAEFCWTCTGYWKDHTAPDGTFRCNKPAVPLKEKLLAKEHNSARRYYYDAIQHRRERMFENQQKMRDNAKRLLGTIPLEKGALLDSTLIRSQIDKRESLLRHLYEMVKYVFYLHRVCEFVAVAADGYGNTPMEFRNAVNLLSTLVFNMSQVFEGGRGYKAIEQLKQMHESSEKLLDRIRRAVTLRELRRTNTQGYVTS